MKIHIRQLPHGTGHFSGEDDASGFGLERADARPLGPVYYDIDVGLSGGGLWAAGKLSFRVELTCVRTLEKFPYDMEIPDFSTQIELHGSECIDLTPIVREDIFLNLPPYPKKDVAELSTSKNAPQRLEISGTDALASKKTEESEENSIWSALDNFEPKN
ncbi:MAG: YceD family protein [Chthoniobacterales bacterium]